MDMDTILNIGLARNDGAPDNGVLRVVASLNDYGFKLLGGEVHEVTHAKGVERTLIAHVEYQHHTQYLPAAINALSNLLAQDCIAVGYVEDGKLRGGDLFGPLAAEWAPFNPDFFVLPTN